MSNIPQVVEHRLHFDHEVQDIADLTSLLQEVDSELSDFDCRIIQLCQQQS